ncbi:hypothetical protein [Vibrio parahaemolyticus]|uniref:hypothetical protein n=1 Tax=Vibrio parahaemolyticus TaxID=670 RepID=UPI003B681851
MSELVDISKQFWQISFAVTVIFAFVTLILAKHSVDMLDSFQSPVREALLSILRLTIYQWDNYTTFRFLYYSRIFSVKIELTTPSKLNHNAWHIYDLKSFAVT